MVLKATKSNVFTHRNILMNECFYFAEESCSRHDSTKQCTGSCGLGVQTGGCVMRGHERNSKMDKMYATCTYETDMCPDLHCDELEDMFPLLCPQDCISSGNVNSCMHNDDLRVNKMSVFFFI